MYVCTRKMNRGLEVNLNILSDQNVEYQISEILWC